MTSLERYLRSELRSEDDRWWVPCKTINGWVADPEHPVEVTRHLDGSFELRGSVRDGKSGLPQIQLPEGMRPVFEPGEREPYEATAWNGVPVRVWSNGDLYFGVELL